MISLVLRQETLSTRLVDGLGDPFRQPNLLSQVSLPTMPAPITEMATNATTHAISTEEAISDSEPLRCPFTKGFDPGHGAYVPTVPSPRVARDATQSALSSQNSGRDASMQNLPDSISESLPTFFHEKSREQRVVRVKDDIKQYLQLDLDLKRLNDIHSMLWMCGRPINARALHRHQVLDRRIVPTEQADLHLLQYSKIILIKPLPAYILSPSVWEEFFNHDAELHKNACGLLLSYVWLIRSTLDFKLATDKDVNLLPPGLEWVDWKQIVTEILQNIDANALDQVNKRYQFGELRLGRINTIYRVNPRFFLSHFVRGYLYGYNRYVPFFQRNVAWILAVSVLLSLILSAMQVGVALDPLQGNTAFKRASYGLVVFSIVLVAVVLAFVGGIFVSVFLYNMFAAIIHSIGEQRRRARMAEDRKDNSKNA